MHPKKNKSKKKQTERAVALLHVACLSVCLSMTRFSMFLLEIENHVTLLF